MSRWRFQLYAEGESEPFHSDLADLGGRDLLDVAGLPIDMAVRMKVALDDERVHRIELVRQPERTS